MDVSADDPHADAEVDADDLLASDVSQQALADVLHCFFYGSINHLGTFTKAILRGVCVTLDVQLSKSTKQHILSRLIQRVSVDASNTPCR